MTDFVDTITVRAAREPGREASHAVPHQMFAVDLGTGRFHGRSYCGRAVELRAGGPAFDPDAPGACAECAAQGETDGHA